MARRGRKRLNLPRYRSGQVKPQGRGERKMAPTPERIARRIEITGRSDLHDAWPLDVLKGRDLITEDQAYAGFRYAALHWGVYGPPASVGGHWRRIGLGFSSFETDFAKDEPDRRRRFLEADQALEQAGPQARKAVLDAAVYLSALCDHSALRIGLESLLGHFRPKSASRMGPRSEIPSAERRPPDRLRN